jgi:hypothetical protein
VNKGIDVGFDLINVVVGVHKQQQQQINNN